MMIFCIRPNDILRGGTDNFRAKKYDKRTGTLVKNIAFAGTGSSTNQFLTFTQDGLFYKGNFSGVQVLDENKTLLRTINHDVLTTLRQVQYGRALNEFVFVYVSYVRLYDTNGTLISEVYRESRANYHVEDLTIYKGRNNVIEAYVAISQGSNNLPNYFNTQGLETPAKDQSTQSDRIGVFSTMLNSYISSL